MRLRPSSVFAVALPLLVACGPSPGAPANDRGQQCLADKDVACARTAFAAAASLREALRLRPDFAAAPDALDIVTAKKAPPAQGGA